MGKETNSLWYVIYILLNIGTLGMFWFIRNLITYAVTKAEE